MTTDGNIILATDTPPKNGQWIETCDVLPTVTAAEVYAGNSLGETIDVDDDDDVGSGILSLRTLMAPEREAAVEKARLLRAVMLDYGVPEVSIELQEGRPSSHGRWDSLFVVSDMSHHTVSRYSRSSLTPVLSLCKRGRSDLPGPLCNGYGGWDLCYRILTFGYANHPGSGGAITVPALTVGSFTIPRDSARRYSWGTEWEGGLNAGDWDLKLRNPRNGRQMTFREFMGRSNAALEEYHKIHKNAHLEHSTWAFGRKIDRLGYTAAEGIAEKLRYGKRDWFTMATKDELKDALRELFNEDLQKVLVRSQIDIDGPRGKETWALARVLRHIMNEQDAMRRKLDAMNTDEDGV